MTAHSLINGHIKLCPSVLGDVSFDYRPWCPWGKKLYGRNEIHQPGINYADGHFLWFGFRLNKRRMISPWQRYRLGLLIYFPVGGLLVFSDGKWTLLTLVFTDYQWTLQVSPTNLITLQELSPFHRGSASTEIWPSKDQIRKYMTASS